MVLENFPGKVGRRRFATVGNIHPHRKQRSNRHRNHPALLPDLLNIHCGQQFLFRQGCGKLLEKLPVGGEDLLRLAVIPLHFGGCRLFQVCFEMLRITKSPHVEGKPVDTGIGEQVTYPERTCPLGQQYQQPG